MRLAAIAAALLVTLASAGAQAAEAFRLEALGEHVHLARPVDPGEHRLERVNALIVDLGSGLLVVEAQPSVAAARELLATIESRWPDREIRYLVLPYPTASSSGGAAAFDDETQLIASYQLVESWDDESYDRGAELRVLSDEPERYVLPSTRDPDLVISGRFELRGDETTVQLDLAQAGYSRGGLVVQIPEIGLFYASALIDGDRAAPLPYVGDTGKWASMLNQLISRDGAAYVGRQGPPLDGLALRRYRDGVAWVRGQVEYGFVKHVPVADLPQKIVADPELAERFALELSPDGGRALIDKTIEEVLAFRRTRGLPAPEATQRKAPDDAGD